MWFLRRGDYITVGRSLFISLYGRVFRVDVVWIRRLVCSSTEFGAFSFFMSKESLIDQPFF